MMESHLQADRGSDHHGRQSDLPQSELEVGDQSPKDVRVGQQRDEAQRHAYGKAGNRQVTRALYGAATGLFNAWILVEAPDHPRS